MINERLAVTVSRSYIYNNFRLCYTMNAAVAAKK